MTCHDNLQSQWQRSSLPTRRPPQHRATSPCFIHRAMRKKQIPDSPTDPKQSKRGFTNGNIKHQKTISFNTSKLRRNPKIDPEAIRVFGEPRSLGIIDKFPKTLAPPRFQIPLRSMPQKTATHTRPGKRLEKTMENHLLMGKFTINSLAIFNSYVTNYQKVYQTTLKRSGWITTNRRCDLNRSAIPGELPSGNQT